jgi:hypothetical protein
MKISWIFFTVLLIAAFVYIDRRQSGSISAAPRAAQQQSPSRTPAPGSHRLADSMQAKLDYIQQNGQKAHPDQRPTVITEEEVNDYLTSGRVQLPQGVNKVKLEGQSGHVNANLNVDFDKIKEGQRSSNPLLGLFSGTHDVRVESDAAGSGGQGTVNVRSVSLDGTEIPRMALEFFVEKYITPKYPNVGMDSRFQLPAKVDTAVVGYHKVTITQK